MPGPRFTPERLAKFIESERVTIAAGIPTIWLGLFRELREQVKKHFNIV